MLHDIIAIGVPPSPHDYIVTSDRNGVWSANRPGWTASSPERAKLAESIAADRHDRRVKLATPSAN